MAKVLKIPESANLVLEYILIIDFFFIPLQEQTINVENDYEKVLYYVRRFCHDVHGGLFRR